MSPSSVVHHLRGPIWVWRSGRKCDPVLPPPYPSIKVKSRWKNKGSTREMKERCWGQRRAGQTQHTISPSSWIVASKVETGHMSRLYTKGYNLCRAGVWGRGTAEGFLHEKDISPVGEAFCQPVNEYMVEKRRAEGDTVPLCNECESKELQWCLKDAG